MRVAELIRMSGRRKHIDDGTRSLDIRLVDSGVAARLPGWLRNCPSEHSLIAMYF
jgi:hypothetical protein